MNKATQWLHNPGRTYQDGVQIYKEVFGMDNQYGFFANAPEPNPGGLHFNLLVEKIRVAERRIANSPEALAEPVKISGPEIRVKPVKAQQSPRFVDNHLVEVTQLPEGLQAKFFRNKEIMKQLAGEHGALKSAQTDAERSSHLEACKELESEKDANWKAIDSWWEVNGKKTDQPAQNTEDANIDKRMETVRKAILRAKKELKDTTLDLKKVKSKKEKIAVWEKEMKDLKAKKNVD